MRKLLILLFVMGLIAPIAQAQTGQPLPRFASLRADEVNLRAGPGVQRYPIEWIYLRRGLPVEIIIEAGTWRKIRDKDGTTGWVHQSMLSGKRTAIVTGEILQMYAKKNLNSPLRAHLQPKVIVNLENCDTEWCRVEVREIEGFVKRAFLWGTYPNEILED
ncbi:MAG: SH3 domain-containing protein [Alphaproteobacteria bacterium]